MHYLPAIDQKTDP